MIMTWISVFLSAFLILQVTSQEGDVADVETVAAKATDWNALIDGVLAKVAAALPEKQMEPMALPDFETGFDITGLIGSHWKLEIGIKNGEVSGLSSIHRAGNATVHRVGMAMNVTVAAQFDDLTISYGFVAQFLGLGPSGRINVIVTKATANTMINVKIIGLKASVLKLDLKLGHIDVDVKGLGLLGLPLELVSTWIANLVKGPIANLIESKIKQEINNVLADGILNNL